MGYFSVPLLTLSSQTTRVIPKFIEKCFRFLLKKENMVEGVFKAPPNERDFERIVKLIDASGEITFTDQTSPITVSHVILHFLDKIPNHILDDSTSSKWETVPTEEKDGKAPYVYVRHLIKKLPKVNQLVLSRIFAFFKIYTLQSSKTGLTVEECARALAPLLVASHTKKQWILDPDVVAIMIKEYKKIFIQFTALESKTSMKSSSKYEEEYIKELSTEFFGGQTMKGLSPNLQVTPQVQNKENKKMCRNVQIQLPNWDRVLHNMLSRDRRYHIAASTSWITVK